MIRQFELVKKIKSYCPHAQEDRLNKAYVFAMKAHSNQQRASGEPYFIHPLEVANILAELRLDEQSIITGLLHDTVEDTETTLNDIKHSFGPDVAKLVDGVTKLSRIETLTDKANQAESFRKFLLAMSEDLRVLLVKLADRLHNMRTLKHIPSLEKRLNTAKESIEIYAPLAERIGLHTLKAELEDLAFEHINPEARASILAHLHFLRQEGDVLVSNVIQELETKLHKEKIKADICGREKPPYSIWRKMRRQNIDFEQLTDITAFRIIVPTIACCYKALGIVHRAYPMIPQRFTDYISTPKPNNYQAIHTSVIGPQHRRIEIQIKTKKMQRIAEDGVAAHWHYKQKPHEPLNTQQYTWLRTLLDILNHHIEPEDFLEHTKMEMFQDQVFCFSPHGALFVLPRGAMPLDYAYAVNERLGHRCVGATINGKEASLSTAIKNGDQVKIITNDSQTPQKKWGGFVVSGKARSHIRRHLTQAEETRKTASTTIQNNTQIISDPAPDIALHYGSCCHPMPDDNIVGVIDVHHHITVHHATCSQLKQLDKKNMSQIPLKWEHNTDLKKHNTSRLSVWVKKNHGKLNILEKIIEKQNIKLNSLWAHTLKDRCHQITMDIIVKNSEQVNTFMAHLRSSKHIHKVKREH